METYFFNPWSELCRCAPSRQPSDDNAVVTRLSDRTTKNGNVYFLILAKVGDYVEYQFGDVLVCKINETRTLMIFGPQDDPFMGIAREWFDVRNTVRPSKRKGEGIIWPSLITATYEQKDWDYLISRAQAGAIPIPAQQPVMAAPTAHAPVQPAMDSDALAPLNPPAATRKPEEPKKPVVATQSLDISDALEMLAQHPTKATAAPPIPHLEKGDAELDEEIAKLGDIDPPAESVTAMPDRRRSFAELIAMEEPIAQEQAKRAAEQRKKQSKKTGLFGRKKDVAIIAATSSMDEDW